jgi:lipopolysaccharide export LptBFGC system permease protein LptF
MARRLALWIEFWKKVSAAELRVVMVMLALPFAYLHFRQLRRNTSYVFLQV